MKSMIRKLAKTFQIQIGLCLFTSLMGNVALADRVNNGGEQSEANVAIASVLYPELIQACLHQLACAPRAQDRELLRNLLASYPLEKNQSGELNYRFLSGTLNPGIFGSQAEVRIWRTELSIGSKIYLNADLFPDQINGRPSVISVRKAFRILFLALASHQGIQNYLYLDQLAFHVLSVNHELPEDSKGPPHVNPGDLDGDGNSKIVPNNPYIRYITAESWIELLWKQLDIYIQTCLESAECISQEWDRQTLQGILKNWRQEIRIPNLIRFESGTRRPDLFKIDGIMKTAVTGLSLGDPIYFNTDRIYTYMAQYNWYASLKQEALLSLLIHEAGHHLGTQDHAKLDLLGFRMSQFFQKYNPWIKFEELYDHLLMHKIAVFNLQLINPYLSVSSPVGRTAFLMTDEMQGFAFNSILEQFMKCPAQAQLTGYRLHTAYWTGMYSRWQDLPPDPSGVDEAYQLLVSGTLLCQLNDGSQLPVLWSRNLDLGYSIMHVEDQRRAYVFKRVMGALEN